jgi:hypothetical protein
MIHTFVVRIGNTHRSYTGKVCMRSRSTISLLLTTPYDMAGRIVRIPVADVVTECHAA